MRSMHTFDSAFCSGPSDRDAEHNVRHKKYDLHMNKRKRSDNWDGKREKTEEKVNLGHSTPPAVSYCNIRCESMNDTGAARSELALLRAERRQRGCID